MRTLLLYFAALLLLVCCDAPKNKTQVLLEYADSLVNEKNYVIADKKLSLINKNDLHEDEDKALYYLLCLQTDYSLEKKSNADSLVDFSISYYKNEKDYEKLTRAYYYKGLSFFASGKVKESLLFMKEAERTVNSADVAELRYLIHINMSLINNLLGINRTALDYARKSLECAKENNNVSWMCFAYNNIAICYYSLGMMDSTFYYIEKIIPNLYDVQDKEERAGFMTNIGLLYYERGDYKKADSLLRKALSLFVNFSAQINLAKTCYKLGDRAECDSLLTEAWPDASVQDKVEILQFRAEMADKAGDYAASSRFYKEAQALQDSARRAMKTEEAVTVQRDYERDKYKEGVWRNVLLAFCVVVLLVLSLTLYYRKRINKAKRTISEGNRLIAEYTARISELEKQDASHAGKVNDLKRKIRNLKDGQAAVLGNGLRLYDEIAAGGTTATWSKKEFDEFIEYYRVGHAEAVASAENGYRRLSSSNIFYLLLLDMGRDDADVQRTMCMTPGALRTMKSRINAKKVV